MKNLPMLRAIKALAVKHLPMQLVGPHQNSHLGQFLQAVAGVIDACEHRYRVRADLARQRWALKDMADWQLNDIGINREEADAEAAAPSWSGDVPWDKKSDYRGVIARCRLVAHASLNITSLSFWLHKARWQRR